MLGIAASVSGQRERALPPLVLLALWAAGACAQGSDVSEGAPGGRGGAASSGGAAAAAGAGGSAGAGASAGSSAGTSGSSTGGEVGVYTDGASTGGASTGGASTGGASTGGAGVGGGSGNAGASGVGGSSGASGAGGAGGGSGGAGGSSGACPADAETSDIEICPGLPLTFTGAPLAVTVTGATNGRSDDYSDCSGAGKESVYRFIAPQDGTVRVTMTPSGIRATIYARANTCASGALIICENPGTIGTPATATFGVTRCGKYYVFADQDIGVLNGTFGLELRYE